MRGKSGLRAGVGCPIAAIAVAAALALAPAASADLSFCPPGSGAGQCQSPEGVAVDRESERLYVADRGNDRIVVFDADGDFQLAFGAVQLDRPLQVAVDNSGGPSQGDVYVVDRSFRVLKFKPTGEFAKAFAKEGEGECEINPDNGRLTNDPIAVGPGGIVHVGDSISAPGGFVNRIHKFDEAGVCLEEIVLFQGQRPFVGLAVDSNEDIYVTVDDGGTGIRKFDSSGVEYGSPYPLEAGTEVTRLGMDEADHLFSAQKDSSLRVIAEYDAAGNTLRRFGYDLIQRNLRGIAPLHSTAGDVFASEESVGLRYFAQPPPGPIVAPSTVKADPIGNAKATLNARINPEGKASSYRFQYVDEQSFENEGGFASPATKSTPIEEIPMAAGTEFRLQALSEQVGCPNPLGEAAEGKCLQPQTVYRFRAIATNADNPSGAGNGTVEGEFETKPPLEIAATYATEVGVDTATLNADVNPLGIPASGYFEYVEEAKFQASGFAEATRVPSEGQLDFGTGEAPLSRSATISLAPGTAYRYRLVAENPLIEPIAGEVKTLTTFEPLGPDPDGPCPNDEFRTGAGAFLPDCRAYEMVSPLDKNNGDIVAPIEFFTELPAALNQSSLSGERLTYSSFQAFGDAQSAPYSSQYLAQRHPLGDPEEGWQTHAIVAPRGAPLLTPGKVTDTEFKAFSADLCDAWIRTTAEPLLAEGAVAGFPNLYRRHDEECGGPGFEALTTKAPAHELTEFPFPAQHYTSLELQGVSQDGAEAIFMVLESLQSAPPSDPQPAACTAELQHFHDCEPRLYLKSEGDTDLHNVCVLPSGTVSKDSCAAGTPLDRTGSHRENWVEDAISADGSRVFWTSFKGSLPQLGKIYLRLNPTAPQSKVSAGECTEAAKACTIAVSEDAEALSGTIASRYWGAAEDGSVAIFTTGNDLYRFDVESETTTPIASEVKGVVGVSDDASHVYFVSEEDLGDGGIAGEPNLYLHNAGTFSLVARLADADLGNPSLVATEPREHIADVSPDGLHLAFASLGSPTGYDNADADNGKAAAEVYLYDAGANEGAGELICASCNPTGARPTGADTLIKENLEYWAAAQLPVWQNTLHVARSLSDDGSRLYFASADVLSPRDTNGAQDVYQWEAQGSGGCDAEDPAFAPSSGGCLSLVSTGKSGNPSEFLDASPSGEDVFFTTLSSLASADYGLVDVYDARVGGGFPDEQPPAVECEGEACQSPPSPPQAPTPASSAYEGPGNALAPGPAKRGCAKGKRRVTRKGRARCVKAQRNGKKANRKRRRAKR